MDFFTGSIGAFVAGVVVGAIGMRMWIAKQGAGKSNTTPPKK